MMNNDSEIVLDDANRLVNRMRQVIHSKDKGALANLRRGAPFSFGEVYPLIENTRNRSHAESVGVIIGEMFGIIEGDDSEMGNFGVSLRRLWESQGKKDGMKRRFNALLVSKDRETLYRNLKSLATWMGTKDVRINFYKLYLDVYYWNEKVARSWASSLYKESQY